MTKVKCFKFKCSKCKAPFTRWFDAWKHGIFCKKGKVIYAINKELDKEVNIAILDERDA